MPSAMIKHHSQKQLGEDGVYLMLHIHIIACHWRKLEQALKAGNEAEALEKCCLLAWSHGLLS